MKNSQTTPVRRSITMQSRLLQKSERTLLPQEDILKEKVKSDFALGHFRGLMSRKTPQKELPKTEIQLKRFEQFGKANQQSKNKRLTFLKYGFRSHEKKNNYYLQPFIRKVREAEGDVANDGSMGVVDLWSDRCINKLMEGMHMTRDNLIVRKMGRELNDSDQQMKQKLEERRLKDKILIESMRMASQDADTFAFKFQLPSKNKKIVEPHSETISVRMKKYPPLLFGNLY
ncbi:unnamed protein product (macronuclear) [Paramecium tetraurelia]|uniref:Uncharacterized protein n=1 Tax=Paramecium tetraurelia TaxID=5888 RepID=A0EF68_PARTE|nr:uncharacterized protein GSPATT00026282001 [Paramecium tetraurelia]CAK93959.1 unnamed protein product [Paramecium tetraurelia]|eukprot:XP_001461332.1 hypothetical protein (macronuclear) [Paramecium tetraurelia strain d4-2]